MKTYVGVLGAGGTVGSAVLRTLCAFPVRHILAGIRHPGRAAPEASVTVIKIDIRDERQLEAFCRQCRTVINCVGASDELSYRVAEMCAREGVNYVDVSGEEHLAEKLLEWDAVFKRKKLQCMFGAGVNPGLTEALTYQLCREYRPEQIEVYFSGSSGMSQNAAVEMLRSCYAEDTVSGAYIEAGQIRSVSGYEAEKKLPEPTGRVLCFPLVNKSFSECIKASPVQTAHYYNTFRTQQVVMCMAMAKLQNPSMDRTLLEKSAAGLVQAFAHEAELYESEFTAVHIFMRKENRTIRKSYVYRGSWNELTGVTAALAAIGMEQGKGRESGAGAAFQLADLPWLLQHLPLEQSESDQEY
ncbi:MAG: saccharopine dehydrogenase NADP-binding domain-containing protein [Lachnospiraceae bacterium]|nr:saccharopine dehydrogenase NADP-binding domain-containing protein [Lachnospiraceae bacterium]